MLSAKKNMDGEYVQCTVFQYSSLAAVTGENCSAATQCISLMYQLQCTCGFFICSHEDGQNSRIPELSCELSCEWPTSNFPGSLLIYFHIPSPPTDIRNTFVPSSSNTFVTCFHSRYKYIIVQWYSCPALRVFHWSTVCGEP